MNFPAIRAIYKFEMARWRRTLLQSIVSPVVSTSLYFVVFGAAIGSRIAEIEGVTYGAFIVPGLIMLMLLTQSVAERLVRHLFPAIRRHDLRDLVGADLLSSRSSSAMSAPRRRKSIILGLIILATAGLFVPHPHRASAVDAALFWC